MTVLGIYLHDHLAGDTAGSDLARRMARGAWPPAQAVLAYSGVHTSPNARGGCQDYVAACLRPPLYATRFGEGFGTLYTAEYRPGEGLGRYCWPGLTWEHSLDRLGPGRIEVRLGPS